MTSGIFRFYKNGSIVRTWFCTLLLSFVCLGDRFVLCATVQHSVVWTHRESLNRSSLGSSVTSGLGLL